MALSPINAIIKALIIDLHHLEDNYIIMLFKLLILSTILSACSHSFDVSTSKGLLKKAKYLSKSGQYIEASKELENIINSNASYNIRASAQLEIAEISFKKEEFLQAEAEYTQGLQIFSKSKLSEKFQYKKALSIYKQLPSKYQRDLSVAPNAILQFQRFIISYPKSTFAKVSKKYIEKIKVLLLKKELYIANFYFTQKKFKASSKRFQKISKKNITAPILFKTTVSTYKAGYPGWTYYYKKLVRLFPKSSEVVRIKPLLSL
ncbi:MAG: outer membrane protein assembly factor BamD [Bdellovibrionales bacterium]|nr:outer membrane protein assembly factor BamD [Bdellovibrionales bacterium]